MKHIIIAALLLLLPGCGGGLGMSATPPVVTRQTQPGTPTLYETRWFIVDGADVRMFWDGEYWCELPPGPPRLEEG